METPPTLERDGGAATTGADAGATAGPAPDTAVGGLSTVAEVPTTTPSLSTDTQLREPVDDSPTHATQVTKQALFARSLH